MPSLDETIAIHDRDKATGTDLDAGLCHDAPATSDVAELMTRCWAPEPSERPAFEELADLLKVRGNEGAAFAPPTNARAPARPPIATSATGRFCTECGAPRTGSKFCGNCGNKHE